MPAVAAAAPARPVVVELVGPAAAGKTSLLRLLAGQDSSVLAGVRPPLSRYVVSAAALLPTYVKLHAASRQGLWKESKRITYLHALLRTVRAHRRRAHHAIVLDEGAVYMLARLGVYGGVKVREPDFTAWRDRTLEQWSQTLDLVIHLEAPTAVLVGRLRNRAQQHRHQGSSDAVLEAFLESYRAHYADVLDALRRRGHVRILEFRTDRESAASIADRIMAAARELGGTGR
jgi:thymidylate kinase